MKKTGTIDFTKGHMLKNFIIFVIPIIFAGLVQMFFNATDLIVTGQFIDANAMAAVGATSSLVSLILALAIGLSVGANVVASIFIGSGNKEMVKKTVDTAVLTAIGCGILCTVVGVLGARPLLILMKTPAEILDLAVVYFRVLFIGIPAQMLYNFCSAILRAAGETRKPLMCLVIAAASNVVLDILLVKVWGVAGIALATAITQYMSAALVLRHMMKSEEIYKFTPKKLIPSLTVFNRILTVGLPSGLQSMVFSLSNIIIQSAVNSLGADVVAGNAAASNIENFVYIAMNAFSVAATTITGQNMGAKQFKRVDKLLGEAVIMVTIIGVTLGAVTYMFGEPLAKLYCPDNPDAIKYSMVRFLWITIPYFLCGIMEVFTGILKSCGSALSSMIISLVFCCGVRIIWIYTVFESLKTLESIYVSYLITWILAIVFNGLIYFFSARKRMNKMA